MAWEIQQWNDYQDRRGPDSDAETLQFFAGYVAKLTKTREEHSHLGRRARAG